MVGRGGVWRGAIDPVVTSGSASLASGAGVALGIRTQPTPMPKMSAPAAAAANTVIRCIDESSLVARRHDRR